jgi:thymidylate synthase
MDEMWTDVLRTLFSQGETLVSRNGACLEVTGWTGTIGDPRRAWTWNPGRKLDPAYGSAELLWYLSGSSDATMLKSYAPSYENYLDDGVHAYGAYGARWREGDQLRNAVLLLKEQPATRQCVITCWRTTDLKMARERGTKDMPCTLTLQLLWRRNALDMIVTMRSNDAWMGMPYDVWCFTCLQRMIAACVDADVGVYHHRVGSLHLYEPHHERARAALTLAAYRGCSALRNVSPGFDCVDEMDRAIGRALDLEKNLRSGSLKELHVIESLLGRTMLGEAVACCAQKLLGVAPAWLDEGLKT